MEKLFEYFAGSLSSLDMTLVIILMSVLLIFIILLIYVPVLTKKILPKFGYVKYSDYLPFIKVYNDDSLLISSSGSIK